MAHSGSTPRYESPTFDMEEDLADEEPFIAGRSGIKIPVMPEAEPYTRVVHNFLRDVYYLNSPDNGGWKDGEFSIPPSDTKPLVIVRRQTHRDEKETIAQRREEALRQQSRDEFAVLSKNYGHPEYTLGFTAYEIVIPSIQKVARPLVFLRTELSDTTSLRSSGPYWANVVYRDKTRDELKEKFPDSADSDFNSFVLRQTTRLLK